MAYNITAIMPFLSTDKKKLRILQNRPNLEKFPYFETLMKEVHFLKLALLVANSIQEILNIWENKLYGA